MVIGRIGEAVWALPLDAEKAWQLADRQRFDDLVGRLAVYIAGKTPEVLQLDESEFVGLIRAKLETAVGARMNKGEAPEGPRVPGMDLIGDWRSVNLHFGLAYGWTAELDEMRGRYWGSRSIEREIGAVRLLNELRVASQDKWALTQLMLPIVSTDDSGKYVLRRRRADWKIEGLHLTHDEKDEKKYRLSEIVHRSEKKRDFTYTRGELAQYLEAFLLSSFPHSQKTAIVDAMLQIRPFDRQVGDYRPGLGGRNDVRRERGKKITLPTGKGFELFEDGEIRVVGEDDPKAAGLEAIDAVFFMALVDAGRLPKEAMDAFYQFEERPNGILFRVNVKRGHWHKDVFLVDFSKPFEEMHSLPSLYAAFLLSRDRRLSEGVRSRVRWHFESSAKIAVVERVYSS